MKFERAISLSRANIDECLERHFLCGWVPIRAPNEFLLTSVFEQDKFAHFPHLLFCGAVTDDVYHALILHPFCAHQMIGHELHEIARLVTSRVILRVRVL